MNLHTMKSHAIKYSYSYSYSYSYLYLNQLNKLIQLNALTKLTKLTKSNPLIQLKNLRLSLCAVLALAAVCSACTSTPAKPLAPLPTVAALDLSRYLGNWYEVSMIPNRFQNMCTADTQANYALTQTWTGDSIAVTNRCRKTDGTIEVANGVAKVVDGSNNTKLKVSFFRPFYGNYWVLALGENTHKTNPINTTSTTHTTSTIDNTNKSTSPEKAVNTTNNLDYDWVLVGEPKREFGWILSRKPVLDAASLEMALQQAVALGYTRNRCVASKQTNPLP